MAAIWANEATRSYPYAPAYGYIPITQANFAGSTGKEQVMIGAATVYTRFDGEIKVTYGASQISVKNTSGVDWVANGTDRLVVHLDMGSTAPIGTNSVPAPGAWKECKPLPGSAALRAALTETCPTWTS